MLKLVNHGGMCCGIKTIYDFPYYKDDFLDEEYENPIKKIAHRNNKDICYDPVSSDDMFFTDAAPQESTEKRLDRYIEFVKSWRPQHVIEVVICSNGCGNQRYLIPYLEKRGFKAVTTAKNSNSDNEITIFHLVIDEPGD